MHSRAQTYYFLHLLFYKSMNVNCVFVSYIMSMMFSQKYFQENRTHTCVCWRLFVLCRMTNNKNNNNARRKKTVLGIHLSVCRFLCVRVNISASNIDTYIFPDIACRFFSSKDGTKPTLIHSNVNAANALDNFPGERKKMCMCI